MKEFILSNNNKSNYRNDKFALTLENDSIKVSEGVYKDGKCIYPEQWSHPKYTHFEWMIGEWSNNVGVFPGTRIIIPDSEVISCEAFEEMRNILLSL